MVGEAVRSFGDAFLGAGSDRACIDPALHTLAPESSRGADALREPNWSAASCIRGAAVRDVGFAWRAAVGDKLLRGRTTGCVAERWG